MEVILYSTHCPRCEVLEEKLRRKGIKYIEENSVEVMQEKGIMSVPVLEYNGELFDFGKAVKLINSL